jgi:hypothetical protein
MMRTRRVHAGYVNVLADELARLCELVPLVVRQQVAEAALDMVNRYLRRHSATMVAADHRCGDCLSWRSP